MMDRAVDICGTRNHPFHVKQFLVGAMIDNKGVEAFIRDIQPSVTLTVGPRPVQTNDHNISTGNWIVGGIKNPEPANTPPQDFAGEQVPQSAATTGKRPVWDHFYNVFRPLFLFGVIQEGPYLIRRYSSGGFGTRNFSPIKSISFS